MIFQPKVSRSCDSELAQEEVAQPFEDFQTSKVEFFTSSSIFDEISLDGEEIDYNELIIQNEVNMIFATLGKELSVKSPAESQEIVEKLINRAEILYKSTMVDFFAQKKKLNVDPKVEMVKYQQRIKELLSNYQLYQKDSIQYSEFCEIYRQKQQKPDQKTQKMFKKEQRVEKIGFQCVEKVQIAYKQRLKHSNFRTANEKGLKFQEPCNNDDKPSNIIDNRHFKAESLLEQIQKLKQSNKHLVEEIHLLKTKLNYTQQSHQNQLKQTHKTYAKRLESIIELKIKSAASNSQRNLLQEIGHLSKELHEETTKHQSTVSKQADILDELNALKAEYLHLKHQANQQQSLNQSPSKSFLAIQTSSSGPSHTKNHQMHEQQIKMLKKQLRTERLKSFQTNHTANLEKDLEIKRLKEQLNYKSQETLSAYFELEKVKILKVQIQESHLQCMEQNKQLKSTVNRYQSELFTAKNSKMSAQQTNGFEKTWFSLNAQKSQQLFVNSPQKSNFSYQSQQLLRTKSFKITPFLSDVIEGFVYFQFLERQFRYRYLRACLRQKQLLYKKNGFQAGVISKLDQDKKSTKLTFTLYLTNASQQPINDIKLKLISSNSSNEVSLKSSMERYSLQPGDQIKVHFDVSVWSYPLGSIAVLFQGLQQQLRILLPLSIVKLFTFHQASIDRDEIKTNSSFVSIKCEPKVIKTFEWLIQSLLSGKKIQNSSNEIGLIGHHQQSGTKVKIWFQYDAEKEKLQIWYFKEIGNLDLADYLMKGFEMIVEKKDK